MLGQKNFIKDHVNCIAKFKLEPQITKNLKKNHCTLPMTLIAGQRDNELYKINPLLLVILGAGDLRKGTADYVCSNPLHIVLMLVKIPNLLLACIFIIVVHVLQRLSVSKSVTWNYT